MEGRIPSTSSRPRLWIENQRGDVNTPGGAIAVLPSKDDESHVPG